MPSQKEVRWSQLKVGVLVVVALAALTALIFLMSNGQGGVLGGRLTLRSYFEDSAGLNVGAPVNLEGVTIGNVKAIHIVPERKLTPVEIVMRVNGRYQNALHTDSKASLTTIGVLGDTVVNIDSRSATGPPVENNGELPTNETPNLSDVIKSSQGTIDQLNTILTKVNSIADALNSRNGSVGELINNPDLYNKATATIGQLQQVVNEVNSGQGSIGKLLTDDSLYNHMNDTVDKLDQLATQLDEGKGSIGKLLKDQTLADNLNRTVANANQLLGDINAGKGGLGLIAKDPQFAAKLRHTVDGLDSLMNKVNSGQGTVGQLVENPAAYNNANQLLIDTRGLIEAMRKNPKMYLTFRVKLF